MNCNNLNIKDAISKYPKLGGLLTAYNIDCVNCEIGTCKLGDILNIHNFPLEVEDIINSQIRDVLDNKAVDLSNIEDYKNKVYDRMPFSQPLEELVQEHDNILRLLNFAEYILSKENFIEQYADKLEHIAFFIKNYADTFHHAKEEDVLFKMLDDNHEVIKVMEQEHNIARALVAGLEKSIALKDEITAKNNLTEYIYLLRKHIKKENEILYVWFQNVLSDKQMEKLARLFLKKDNSEIRENLLFFLYTNYV